MKLSIRLLLLLIFAATVGCRPTPTPSAPELKSVVHSVSDDNVLRILDCYDLLYMVNAEGRVIWIRLAGQHIPPEVVTEVGKLTELEGIDCFGSTLTDEGVTQLKHLKHLRNLGVGGTKITDQALIHMEQLPSLRWVWVPRNQVTQAAIDKLKVARPDLNVYPQ